MTVDLHAISRQAVNAVVPYNCLSPVGAAQTAKMHALALRYFKDLRKTVNAKEAYRLARLGIVPEVSEAPGKGFEGTAGWLRTSERLRGAVESLLLETALIPVSTIPEEVAEPGRPLMDIQNPAAPIATDPSYYYHATNEERALDIAATQLETHEPSYGTDQPAWPDGGVEPRSYFSGSPEVVRYFAPEDGKSVVLRIDRRAQEFKTEKYTGDVYATKPTPSEDLEVLRADGTWVGLKRHFIPVPADPGKRTIDTARVQRIAAEWAENHAGEMVAGISQTDENRIGLIVARGIEGNHTIDQVAQDILFYVNDDQMTEARARAIATTETNNALSFGAHAAYEGSGAVAKDWFNLEGACEVCQENEAAGIIPIRAIFPSGHMHPTAHPWCRCFCQFYFE